VKNVDQKLYFFLKEFMTTVISVENLSKAYRLGQIGTGTFSNDLQLWWARLRGKPNPLLRIGDRDHSNRDGETLWALKDVSFQVEQGEVLGIIGRNGAGKSTLLKILSRVTAPTSGRIRVKGRIASLLEVGTGFHPELTGRENIYLNGAILGMKRNEITRKFDEIVDFSGVEKFIDTPVKRYSSGMYVRLAFAVAGHLEPEILVVDEVLAVGDAEFQKKCLGKMGDVAKQGRTVLFVSHNMAAVQSLCPRGIVLLNGEIIADATTVNAVKAYLASMRSETHFNLAERKDRKGEGQIRFTNIEFLNEANTPIVHAVSGQRVTIRLHYVANRDKAFKNCRASVSVHKDGKSFFLTSTELVESRELVLQGKGHLDCILDELPLSQGKYHLDPFVESNKVIQDWVESAAELSVLDGDFYRAGKIYPPGWQGKTVLVRHRWVW
jgi:lipopolysaccharide transport system ATP-binding protein